MSLIFLLLACSATPPTPPPPAGPRPCATCHADAVASHATSHHAASERVGDEGAITLPTADGDTAFPYTRTIGVAPLWQPLVPRDRGRVQASHLAFDPVQEDWFSVFDDVRAPGDWGHWTGRGMTWNSQCAHCHNTEVDPGYDPTTDAYATTMVADAVTCEACHGDGTAHATDPTAPIADGAGSCLACHTRGAALATFTAEASLLDQVMPAMPDLDADWHVDGSIATESFEGAAFLGSRMHAVGLTCSTCHDGHAPTAAEARGACATCHVDDHSHHEDVHCVDCHMPTNVFMQRHRRHDHGFHIPDVALERELGLPSACASCHDLAEVQDQAAAWWTPRPERRRRAEALTAARAGDPSKLAAAVAAEAHPIWRATLQAVGAPGDPRSEDPWERLAAAHALPDGDRALRTLAEDDVRAVRIAAQRRLVHEQPPWDRRATDLRAWLLRQADQPLPSAELGAWWAAAGRPEKALPHLRRAIRFDPSLVDARRNLAVVLSSMGQANDAAVELGMAVTLAPDDAELHFLHGLAVAGIGGDPEPALARAAELGHPRARYNLAVLVFEADPERAARLLEGLDDPDAAALRSRL